MKVWECPKCKWIISDTQYMSIIIDAPCGRCGNTHLSHFRSKEMSETKEKK